jgi:putative component of membrane protein insertase Oxa1/YidC/SpoIIIJ protein YidD
MKTHNITCSLQKLIIQFNYKNIKKIPNYIIYALIAGLRPLLGPDARCKFTITCTPFALHTLKTEPFFKAIWIIIKRILSCNPFRR